MTLYNQTSLSSVELELEQELEIAARFLEAESEYGFCNFCRGVVEKRGRRWICKACGARYNSNPSGVEQSPVGPPQAHHSNVSGSKWNTHSRRRSGGAEKKDNGAKYRKRQREFESELEQVAKSMDSVILESEVAELEADLAATGTNAEQMFEWWRRRRRNTKPQSPPATPIVSEGVSPYRTQDSVAQLRHYLQADARAAAVRLRNAQNALSIAQQNWYRVNEEMQFQMKISGGDPRLIDSKISAEFGRMIAELQRASTEFTAARAAFDQAMKQRHQKAWH